MDTNYRHIAITTAINIIIKLTFFQLKGDILVVNTIFFNKSIMLFFLLLSFFSLSNSSVAVEQVRPDCSQPQTSGTASTFCDQVRADSITREVRSKLGASTSKQWNSAVQSACQEIYQPWLHATGWKSGEANCSSRLNKALLKELNSMQRPNQ